MTTFGDMVYGLGGVPLVSSVGMGGPNVIGAKTVYFVDGNYGNDSNSGKNGWGNAFKTLTVALAASHADIASGAEGWAARNVIFCKGDTFDEDLVLLAQKTDVVGLGSWDSRQKCGLRGNHVPTGTTAAYGTRFYNFEFVGDATTGGVLWTLDSTCLRTEFHNCDFVSTSSTEATTGILATASRWLGVYNCNFYDDFSTACISIAAGNADGLKIIGNKMMSAAVGVLVNASATCANEIGRIADNEIYAATLAIDENADKFLVYRNILFSETATLAAGVDSAVALSVGNYYACTALNQLYPTEDTAE
jgi:hypothetical protein